jgi:PknH-like extracellular domain
MAGIAAVCAAVLTAGCAVTVAGKGEPARDSAGIVGVGRSITDVLPTRAELAAVLRSPVEDSGFPPSVGDSDVLSSFLPEDACAGVAYPMLKDPYRGTPVRAVADKNWSGVDTRFRVQVGAVALASPRDARAVFARFVEQWQRCQGKSVVLKSGPDEVGIPDYRHEITGVSVTGPVLTAVVMLTSSGSDSLSLPNERAMAVAYNCIIDVEVTDFRWREGSAPTSGHARDVAEKMMTKAGA